MKKTDKPCKHEWVYCEAVLFYRQKYQKEEPYYRAIWNCKKCQQVDIQTIYE